MNKLSKFAAAFAAVLCAFGAMATDIVVDTAGGEGVYKTLSEAFAAAKTAESPRVVIREGEHEFTETITLDYPVMVVGADMTNSVLTGANLQDRAFVVSDAGVVISNLTFRGIYGKAANNTYGVAVTMSAGLVVDCRFLNNYCNADYVGGAGVSMSDGKVLNCYFSGNGGKRKNGGVVYGLRGGQVNMSGGTLEGCTLRAVEGGSTASYGKCLLMSGGTVTNCVFRDNSSGYEGGGVYMSNGTLTHCLVTKNSGSKGGGVYASGGTVKDCVIVKNSSNGSAGGIYCEGATVRHCTVYGNTSSGATVGCPGIYMTRGTAYDNIIWGNTNGKDDWLLGSCYVTGGTFNTNIIDVAVSRGVGNQAADPLFTDAANGDFRVKLGSPAIGAGTPGGGYDFAGVARSATASTCGAYEFSSAGGDLQVAMLIRQGEYAEGDTVTVEVMTAGGDGTPLSYKWYLNGSDEVCSTDEKLVLENCAAAKLSIRVEVSQEGGPVAGDEKADAILVYPRHVYVNDTCESPTWPYATPDTAATSIHDAYAALWKDANQVGYIDLEEGTYPLSSGIAINQPIEIRGKGLAKTLIDATPLSGAVSAFTLANDGGVISGLTIKVGVRNDNESHGGGVNMSKGLLADCRITGSNFTSFNSSGGPLYMTGGRAERCQFDDAQGCWNTGSKSPGVVISDGTMADCTIFNCGTGNYGGGLTVSGSAVVERTVIRDCNGSSQGTGVYMTGGTLVNCLIYGNKNTSSTSASGVYISGGTMKYCTIYGNATTSDGDGRSGVQVNGAATLANNIIWGNGPAGSAKGSIAFTGSGYVFKGNVTDTDTKIATNVAGDPKFKDAASADFHIKGASAARGLAVLSYKVATDFDGVERAEDGHCSGAYEYVKGTEPLSVDITLSTPTRVKVGTEITFTAVPENAADESSLTYAWTLDGDPFGTTKTLTTDEIAPGKHAVAVSVTEGALTVSSQPVEFWVQPVKVYAGPLKDGVTPRYPYDDPSIAATNLNDALAALWQSADSTGTVEIAEGVVQMTGGVTLGTPVKICGAGRDKSVVTGKSAIRLFTITDPDVEVSDLCVSNFTFAGGSEDKCGAFKMSKGVVRRVRISDIKTNGNNCHYNDALGVYMTGGRFEDSEIINCTQSGYYANGCGVYMADGTMDRCLVKNCKGARSASGGGHFAGGEVRNTLFEGCSAGLEGGGYAAVAVNASGKAKLINCTVVGSPAGNSETMPAVKLSGSAQLINSIVWNGRSTPDVTGASSAIIHSCHKDATGEGNVAANPCFRNAANGDYRIRVSSPCVDKGDWTYLGATKDELRAMCDLNGSPRFSGESVDMGCCENPQTGMMLIVR